MPKTGRAAVLAEGVRLPFPKKRAVKYAEKILSMSGCKKDRVCILFTGDTGIKKLNKKYMKRDRDHYL